MPRKNGRERWRVPGGKSKARARLKWARPDKMIHAMVPTTTSHISFESAPILVIRRYRRKIAIRQPAIATNVPAETSQFSSSVPRTDKPRLSLCAA